MANGILVVLENNDGKISRIGWETLTAAQKIGSDLGIDVSAAVLGKDAKAMADSAAGKQADTICAASNAALENYTPDGYTAALEQVIAKAAPRPDHQPNRRELCRNHNGRARKQTAREQQGE